jgi:hypothetical protein
MAVKVTQVTVVYEKDGRAFVVELDPDVVGTIVFKSRDFRSVIEDSTKKPEDRPFDAAKGFPPQAAGVKRVLPQPSEPLEMMPTLESGEDGFWWRDNGTWHHAQ